MTNVADDTQKILYAQAEFYQNRNETKHARGEQHLSYLQA
jgi:hypothetical protein